ncbi:MAG: VirB3 family type IV secretion system protein [Sphingomonas sp.]|nr:VirB3 family type IV secretion system protein [Sphingomonas sp.]
MAELERDRLFVALTRPQVFAGVPYSFLVINAIATTELFLIFKSPWVFLAALLLHLLGFVTCLGEPRFFDLWLVKASRCPRVRNYRLWRCNSYRA